MSAIPNNKYVKKSDVINTIHLAFHCHLVKDIETELTYAVECMECNDVQGNVQGEWIKHGKEVECDNCGAIFNGGTHKLLGTWKFCPNCGAYMRGDEE